MKSRPIKSIEDLRWYFVDSPAALGMHAQVMSDTSAIPSANRDYCPSDSEVADANRQRRIQREVSQLSSEHKSVLEVAYELRNDFMPRGNDAEIANEALSRGQRFTAAADESERERQLRLNLAAPVVRKVRLQYQAAYDRAEEMVKAWERDEKQAKKDKDEDEIAWTKAQLSGARTLKREIRERARAAERQGVEMLREAHRAYRAVRKQMREEHKADAKLARELRVSRRRGRAQEGKQLGKALRNLHDEELDAIVQSLMPMLGHGFGDRTAKRLHSEGLAGGAL